MVARIVIRLAPIPTHCAIICLLFIRNQRMPCAALCGTERSVARSITRRNLADNPLYFGPGRKFPADIQGCDCASKSAIQDFPTQDSGFPFTVCSRRRLHAIIGGLIMTSAKFEAWQRRRAMISEWGDRKARVQDVNSICMRLFDTWCESRNLMPLAYLMHCWPLPDSRAGTIRRLQESMKDLRRNHADKLDLYALSALGELARTLDELIDRAEISARQSFAT
ncbi:hypothetical protein [Paraburkholderia sp. BR10882]|uniref:hypothetical protein n=1 Tax=unclassified Paraburkholderia TaxID=2615204 RepID=UPI0034CDF223